MKYLKFVIAVLFLNIISSSVIAGDALELAEAYKSSGLGIEFKYPTSWTVSEDSDSVNLRKLIKKENRVIYITLFVQQGQNPNNYTRDHSICKKSLHLFEMRSV